MKKSFTVHDLPLNERPRERLIHFGPESLSLAELLAIILRSGSKGEPVTLTAQKLLSSFGSINHLSDASIEDLQKIKGLGPTKAAELKATFELARRLHTNIKPKNRVRHTTKTVVSPEDVYQLVKAEITKYSKEYFWVVSFDTRKKVLGIDMVSVGTLNASLVHPRETFEPAIKRHAESIVIVHNHPSGDPEPSDADILITKKLFDAGKLLDITLLDHVIVTKNSYYSLKGGNLF
jgi:DNA repair protein RadC